MPKRCDCPGELVWEKGKIRVEAEADTEDAAVAAMEAKLPQAKTDAETAQTAAYRAALAVGHDACVQPCEALFWCPPVDGPWKGVVSLAPYDRWLARGGYRWKVIVECELDHPGIAARDGENIQKQLKE